MYGEGIPAVYSINDNNNRNNTWGDNGIWVILLLALFGGWGGGFGGGFGGGAAGLGLQASIDTNSIMRDVFATNQNVSNQGCDTRSAITNTGYQIQNAIQNLSSQYAACCCETNRNIDAIRYENAKNTCDITTAIYNDGARTRELMQQLNYENKIATLETSNQELRLANQNLNNSIINTAQTQTLTAAINNINPRPVPSYNVCNPHEMLYPSRNGYGYGYGFNGCGYNGSCC